MARIYRTQAAHTYGVLDPLMIERRDTKFVPGSLAAAENVIVLPQGGWYARGGTERIAPLRQRLIEQTISAAWINAPNGGDPALLVDGDDTTTFVTNEVDSDSFVLFRIDFPEPTRVEAFDVTGFWSQVAVNDALKLLWFDGSTWRDFGPHAFDLPARIANRRNRRFALPPGETPPLATAIRAVVVNASAAGPVRVRQVRCYVARGGVGSARVFAYNRDVDARYVLVATEFNLDIFKDGQWLAAAWLGATQGQLAQLKHEPAFDTVLFFHRNVAPWRLFREGGDDEWHSGPAAFTNLPLVDLGRTYTNGVNEIQEIRLISISAGHFFELQLEGEITTSIERLGSDAATATAIKQALEALPNVDASGGGLTVTVVASGRYQVEFTGGANAARDWLTMEGISLTDTNGVVAVREVQKGVKPGEPIMSQQAGWPTVGRFIQNRLVLAGFRSRPAGVLMSVTGDPFNMDTRLAGASAAIQFDIDDNEEPTIRDITIKNGICFLTDARPWRMVNETLSAEDAPKLEPADAPGIDPAVRPASLDNAVFYVQSGGAALRMLTFSALDENVIADNASVLSAFTIRNPVAMALRRAVAGNDADLLVICNSDGGMTTATMMRTQDVSGFAPHTTRHGRFRDVCVTGDEVVWIVAERDLGAGFVNVLERIDGAGVLDSATDLGEFAATDTLTGLESYEGTEIAVIAGGDWMGEHLVENGQVSLPRPVTQAVVGFWSRPFATDVPVRLEDETGRPAPRMKRVNALTLSLVDTTSVAVAANGGEPVDIATAFLDETPLDEAPPEHPVTGRLRLEGWRGWSESGQVTITQVRPGKLTVRAVEKEVVA